MEWFASKICEALESGKAPEEIDVKMKLDHKVAQLNDVIAWEKHYFKRLTKTWGIFKMRSTLQKYAVIYDPDIVLQYVTSLLMCCRCFSSTKIFL